MAHGTPTLIQIMFSTSTDEGTPQEVKISQYPILQCYSATGGVGLGRGFDGREEDYIIVAPRALSTVFSRVVFIVVACSVGIAIRLGDDNFVAILEIWKLREIGNFPQFGEKKSETLNNSRILIVDQLSHEWHLPFDRLHTNRDASGHTDISR